MLIGVPVWAAEPTESGVLARLAETEEQTGAFFWPQEDREVGFPNMPRLSPSRLIERGDSPLPLASATVDLADVGYTVDGKNFRLRNYLADPAHMGLIVVRGEQILFENYSGGNNKESVWVSFSVTKSVSSMLIGAAIQDGFIKSVNEPVVNYLPRLRGSIYERLLKSPQERSLSRRYGDWLPGFPMHSIVMYNRLMCKTPLPDWDLGRCQTALRELVPH